jgi:probable rRNA maturation factor
MAVQLFFLKKTTLLNRTALKRYISLLFKKEGQRLTNLNIIFCSDDYLLEINKNHLQHNYFTDIITFNLTPPNQLKIEAELYISVDRVKDNARQLGQTYKKELHRVIFHGCLHLCGYKDKNSVQIKAMRAAEEKHLSKYFS